VALTDTSVRQAWPSGKPRKLSDERGLYLLIHPNGGKYWRLKYRFAGTEKLLALGTYPDVGLKEARQKRGEARNLLAVGKDPSAERKAEKARLLQSPVGTFEAVSREWFEKFSSAWAPTHAQTVIRRLERDVLPWIGERAIQDITPVELLTVLRRVETRGALETAHRIKQVCGQVFRYAIATARAARDPSADLRGALPAVREKHHPALTKPAEIGGLMRAIASYEGSFVVRCALRIAALVFVRPGELRKAEWSEIDFDDSVWRIPAQRMKMRSEHLVPLSSQAGKILRELQSLTGAGRYVFPNARDLNRPLSDNAVLAALRRMGYGREEMTGHGFRTVASTLLNESGWSADVIERQLAHAERDQVRGAYNRAEYLAERRRMMQAWADHLDYLADHGSSPRQDLGLTQALSPNSN
jgi:integrase